MPKKIVFLLVAPNFKLKMLNGETEVELAGFAGKTPVVLIFGSYT